MIPGPAFPLGLASAGGAVTTIIMAAITAIGAITAVGIMVAVDTMAGEAAVLERSAVQSAGAKAYSSCQEETK